MKVDQMNNQENVKVKDDKGEKKKKKKQAKSYLDPKAKVEFRG